MKVTFANDYTTPGGRTYKAGTTAEINNIDARTLIHKGKAVAAETSPASTRAKSATAEPTSAAAETTTPPAEG